MNNENLLTLKYKPKKFTDLISDIGCNIQILKWCNSWIKNTNTKNRKDAVIIYDHLF